jgi:hypothetical protein
LVYSCVFGKRIAEFSMSYLFCYMQWRFHVQNSTHKYLKNVIIALSFFSGTLVLKRRNLYFRHQECELEYITAWSMVFLMLHCALLCIYASPCNNKSYIIMSRKWTYFMPVTAKIVETLNTKCPQHSTLSVFLYYYSST